MKDRSRQSKMILMAGLFCAAQLFGCVTMAQSSSQPERKAENVQPDRALDRTISSLLADIKMACMNPKKTKSEGSPKKDAAVCACHSQKLAEENLNAEALRFILALYDGTMTEETLNQERFDALTDFEIQAMEECQAQVRKNK